MAINDGISTYAVRYEQNGGEYEGVMLVKARLLVMLTDRILLANGAVEIEMDEKILSCTIKEL